MNVLEKEVQMMRDRAHGPSHDLSHDHAHDHVLNMDGRIFDDSFELTTGE